MSYEHSYDYAAYNSGGAEEGLLLLGTVFEIGIDLIIITIFIFEIVCIAKLFKKAGEEWWSAIIPFYNYYILFKLSWGNGWLFLLLLIPYVNFVIFLVTLFKLGKAFGMSDAFCVGLIFLQPIFMGIMAFSNDIQYTGTPNNKDQYYNNFNQNGYIIDKNSNQQNYNGNQSGYMNNQNSNQSSYMNNQNSNQNGYMNKNNDNSKEI